MTEHFLKVAPPYFAALLSGDKTFEVRKNDRMFQRGDKLILREWHPGPVPLLRSCQHAGCDFDSPVPLGHWSRRGEAIERVVTYVYSGDPRFGGIEPGYVVLGLGGGLGG